jgi:hypothetical protein
MVERFAECEDALRSLVVSREYEDWMRSSAAELRNEARYASLKSDYLCVAPFTELVHNAGLNMLM